MKVIRGISDSGGGSSFFIEEDPARLLPWRVVPDVVVKSPRIGAVLRGYPYAIALIGGRPWRIVRLRRQREDKAERHPHHDDRHRQPKPVPSRPALAIACPDNRLSELRRRPRDGVFGDDI